MEINKIPSCWPTSFFFGIPVSENKIKSSNQQKSLEINPKFLDFIFQMCLVSNLSNETAQTAILMLETLLKNPKTQMKEFNLQLLTMGCILVSSKMNDVTPINLSLLHKNTNNIFNNSTIIKIERFILESLEYKLLFRDKLIADRVGLYLEAVRNLILPEAFKILENVSCLICNLIYEDINFIARNDFFLLSASIIHAALVISTKRDGKLIITVRLSLITGYKDEDIIKLAMKIIKFCLGKEIYKKYNFN